MIPQDNVFVQRSTISTKHRLVPSLMLVVLLTGLIQPVNALTAFDLLVENSPTTVVYQGENQVVQTAIDMLFKDANQVCDGSFKQGTTVNGRTILIGMPDQEPDFRDLLKQQKVGCKDVVGKWEAFKHVTTTINGQPCLLVIGSDPRGTAYGVLELSRHMGVSPWAWWADVTPAKQTTVTITPNGRVHAPSVQYRGIFLNDEDWGLMPWSSQNFEPGPRGQIGPKTYAKIFELLLRLRANTIWPAMHECTIPFYQVPGNDGVSRKYGIVVGSSHCEPLLYNSAGEWNEASMSRYNFFTNKDKVLNAWTNRVAQMAGTDNHFYTIGMRGKHDGRMEGVSTAEAYKEALETVIPIQRNLLAKHINPDPTKVPQAFIPYKEVLEVYDLGMKVPDDVTLIWCDDNYGYLTRLSNPNEQKRNGGAGVYYHLSYWGRPHDYLWLATTPPAQIFSEMRKAWDYNTRKLWIANVGDIKPGEYLTEFYLDMAWDIESVSPTTLTQHLERWAAREFGAANAKAITAVMSDYYRLGMERKPEFMGWNAVELSKQTYHRGLSPVTDTDYNPLLFGDEIKQRIDAFDAMIREVDRIEGTIPAHRKAAFFQLVRYPVMGAALKSHNILLAQKARLFAQHNLPVANEYANASAAAWNTIQSLTNHYNAGLMNGKWKGMMDSQPRKLPVFDRAPLPATVTQKKSGVVFWPENATKPLEEGDIVAPAFVKEAPRTFFVSLFSGSGDVLTPKVEGLPTWVKVETVDMGVDGETRLVFSADFDNLSASLPLNGQATIKVGIDKTIRFEALSYGVQAAAYEVNGLVAMNAAEYSSAKGTTLVEGLGHSGKAVNLLPAIKGYNAKAPVLTYDVMTTSVGEAEVRVYVLPVRPMNGGDVRVAVSIDNGTPQELSFKTVGRSKQWMGDVLRNQAIVTLKHTFKTAGRHTITLYTPDKDIVIDQLAVDFQPERRSYLVPVPRALATQAIEATYDLVHVEAPFPMQPIRVYRFPAVDFNITAYGAQTGTEHINTSAIAQAIKACHEAGGGRVVVPAGEWWTGPIHFRSGVNLHVEEGAVIRFVDDPAAYLPAVMTSWEGMECFNYSPLVYAYECENIAITGKGTLQPKMDLWKTWFSRPAPHMEALKQLYTLASTNVPVEQRQMAEGANNLRPHLIHFNRCKNVLLDGFNIRESPFWTIHLYLCDGGVARNLNVRAHGHNNDGIDLEMTRNVLVEDCVFDQGDDAVVIKAGRNQDAWRLNTPCENIVVRNCSILKGHTLLGIGSEMSGGVRNVYMHHCAAPNNVYRFFFLKTNHRRGGFIENIYMENVQSGSTQRLLEIDTDVLYQWRDLVPTYETRLTRIENIVLRNATCDSTDAVYELKGDARLPIRRVEISGIKVGKVSQFVKSVKNAVDVIENDLKLTILPDVPETGR